MENKLDFVFKKILNRTYSSTDKDWFEEKPAGTLRIKSTSIFIDDIPVTPPAETTELIQVFTQHQLFKDNTTPDNKGWYFDYPEGYRVVGLIIPSYGVGYSVRIYDGSLREIPTTDGCGWIFDYENAYLAFDTNPATYGWDVSHIYISIYRYIGRTLNDFIIDYVNDLSSKIDVTEKGAAGGVAPLDAFGIIPEEHLPLLSITDVFVANSEEEMTALTAQVGDVAVRTDVRLNFILRVSPATVASNWQELIVPEAYDSSSVTYTTLEDSSVENVEEALDKLIYTYPAILSFVSSPLTYQIGLNISAILFSWTLNKTYIVSQSLYVKDLTNNNDSTKSLAVGLRTYNFTDMIMNGDIQCKLTVSDGTNSVISTFDIYCLNKLYSGVSSAASLDSSSDVLALENKELKSTFIDYEKEYDCTGGKYIFIAFPKRFGQPSKVYTNENLDSAWIISEMMFTNENSYSEDYYIMRHQYKQNSDSIMVRIEI